MVLWAGAFFQISGRSVTKKIFQISKIMSLFHLSLRGEAYGRNL